MTPDPTLTTDIRRIEELAARTKIIQTMQAVLKQPPSDALKAYIQTQRVDEKDPTMLAFLNLLVTDNQRNRDIAYAIFKDLEKNHVEEARRLNTAPEAEALPAPGAITAAASAPAPAPAPPSRSKITVEIDPDEPDREKAIEDALAAFKVKKEAQVADEAATPATGALVPLVDESLETITYTLQPADGEVPVEKTYSILTPATSSAILGRVRRVAAVLIGTPGQYRIEHGFGFVLPTTADGLPIALEGEEALPIKIAMGYPSAISVYDHHEAPSLPGLADFMLMHEAMMAGYVFLLDLRLTPLGSVKGRTVHFGKQLHCFIERRSPKDGQAMSFDSRDLHRLAVAASRLDFVGILAETEEGV